MFFRNLCVFEVRGEIPEPEAFAEALAGLPFRSCSSQELLSDGWVPPLGRKAVDLVHAVGDCILVCLQVEEKVLPAAVIKELLTDKVDEIQDREQRHVARREKDQLRDELLLDLLPRAFTRSRRSYAYIDRQKGWLVIDSASPKGIEEITSKLRESLGTLPVVVPRVANAPQAVMTEWLREKTLPAGIELDDECELRDGDGVVRCKGQDLVGEEIAKHLEAGKAVTRLAVRWNDRLSLLLGDDLLVRRLKFLDLALDQMDDTDSHEQQFDAEFALLSGEMREFLPALFGCFGGLIDDGAM